jgi:hypothetical protein
MKTTDHVTAIESALAGDWDRAHRLVQQLDDPLACWIHAILHKIEGNAGNARYWYARTAGKRYEDFADQRDELRAALQEAWEP